MPGCDPAGTTPPRTPTAPPRATVVHLHRHGRREEPPMHGPRRHHRGDDPTPPPADPAAALLAEHVQALYLHRRQSLADPHTAAAYDTALELVLSMVDAVSTQGHATAEEVLDRLRHMLAAARRVPGTL